MCGRIFVKSSVSRLITQFSFAKADAGLDNLLPNYNGAPSQHFPIIVREPDTPGAMFMGARWGYIPRWMKDAKGGHKPINAKAETVATNGMFRSAYKARRALLPIDGFFEWQAIKGQKVKQPYAIALTSGEPFCLAAIWETWRDPESGDDINTFAVVTCEANELMNEIHHRMPVIVAPDDYVRWIGEEPDPSDLLKPYPSELMKIWPISRRVNSPRNNEPSILDLFEEET